MTVAMVTNCAGQERAAKQGKHKIQRRLLELVMTESSEGSLNIE